ncbi:MAG: TatD family hydrolase, partial [Desulfobacterales bacterium]
EDHGWLFSIPPSIVRSPQKQKLASALPLTSLALESDSPVLGPDREVRNEPANIAYAVRCIADLKGVDEETVKDVTTQNAKRLFGLI